MPNPSAPPPERAPPPNLDELVRQALRGGSVDAVRRALVEPGPAGKPPPLAPASPPPVQEAPPRPPGPPGHRDPVVADALARLSELAARAAESCRSEDPAAFDHAVSALVPVLDALRDAIPAFAAPAELAEIAPADAPPRVTLPAIRFEWALHVDGAEGADVARLAAALEVDIATARSLAVGRHGRVALRGAEEGPLERRAASVRLLGIHATVLSRSRILELPPALTALGRDQEGWRVSPEPLWEADVTPGKLPSGVPVVIEPVVVVPGEVEVREQRAAREPSRWERSRLVHDRTGAERRLLVVDLHLPERVVRVVEGVTDLRGLPGFVEGSSRGSMKGFIDALATLWPVARIEPRRPCLPAPAGASGWPAWEEHSRMVRLHRWG